MVLVEAETVVTIEMAAAVRSTQATLATAGATGSSRAVAKAHQPGRGKPPSPGVAGLTPRMLPRPRPLSPRHRLFLPPSALLPGSAFSWGRVLLEALAGAG